MAKTALVTGACGFTGSHMVEHLTQSGWDVVATDLKKAEHGDYYCESGDLHPSYDDDVISKLKVEFIPADLTKPETLAPVFAGRKYDVVFHVASLYDYFAEWDVLYKVNVEGVANIAKAAQQAGVGRFVHWSTDGVYGEIKNPPGTEDDPYDPPNLYSKSKTEQEKILWRMYQEEKFPLTVVRPAPIYGPRHRYGVYHILYGIQKMGTGVLISWYPKKHTLMIPSVHVLDLVRAASFVAEKEEAVGQAYNVLSDCIPQPEFMEFLYQALGVPYLHVPIWWPLYKFFAAQGLEVVKRIDTRARKKGLRPKVDVPMIEYITHQYWFSNQKLKDLGYQFVYQNPKRGIWEYITWCKERGWLE